MKLCVKCQELLPETSFHKSCRYPDGLKTFCKSCRKTHETGKYNAAHRVEINAKNAALRSLNPNRFKEYYRQNIQYFKDYNDRTSDKRREYGKTHRKRILKRVQERYASDGSFRLKCLLRSRLSTMLSKAMAKNMPQL